MKSTILCLCLFMVAILIPASYASTESAAGSRNQLDSCSLDVSKDETRSLPYPKHLSFVQHSYLSELCEMLSIQVSTLHADAMDNDLVLRLKRKASGTDEIEDTSNQLLALEKDLHDVRLQNWNNLAEILKRAITASVFDEKKFWKAWREEKRRHEKIDGPLRTKIAHLTFRQNDKVDRLLKDGK